MQKEHMQREHMQKEHMQREHMDKLLDQALKAGCDVPLAKMVLGKNFLGASKESFRVSFQFSER